jgi:peroxiredoxin
MPAINPGSVAPPFALATTGGSQYDIKETLRNQPLVVISFFKVSCPVCQFIMPYLERLHRSYPQVPIWGVSQDDQDATVAFARMYGASFPMVLDETLQTTVDYGLTNVPTVFVIGQDGKIKQTIVGFAKKDLEELNQTMAAAANSAVKPLFTDADEVPDLRPG